MLENKSNHSKGTAQSEARQVKALLRLVEDLGYEVNTGPAGEWTVSLSNHHGERTIIGVDSAQEVVATAKQLAESLQVDRSLTLEIARR